jgi:hypothetical protein
VQVAFLVGDYEKLNNAPRYRDREMELEMMARKSMITCKLNSSSQASSCLKAFPRR